MKDKICMKERCKYAFLIFHIVLIYKKKGQKIRSKGRKRYLVRKICDGSLTNKKKERIEKEKRKKRHPKKKERKIKRSRKRSFIYIYIYIQNFLFYS